MSILIEEWMIGGMLGLKGCELLVFAYAYSFYRDGKKLFASEGNLGSLICYSRKQVGLSLDRLCEKGLLLRSESKHPGHNTYCYSVCRMTDKGRAAMQKYVEALKTYFSALK